MQRILPPVASHRFCLRRSVRPFLRASLCLVPCPSLSTVCLLCSDQNFVCQNVFYLGLRRVQTRLEDSSTVKRKDRKDSVLFLLHHVTVRSEHIETPLRLCLWPEIPCCSGTATGEMANECKTDIRCESATMCTTVFTFCFYGPAPQ